MCIPTTSIEEPRIEGLLEISTGNHNSVLALAVQDCYTTKLLNTSPLVQTWLQLRRGAILHISNF